MGPKPDLDLVQARDDQSSGAWPQSRPFQIVCRHSYPQPEPHPVTATTGRMHVGGLVLTGPTLPHEGVGGGLMTGRTLAPGLHGAEQGVAHTCHQAGFNNVPHRDPRVLAKEAPPTRVCSPHRSGVRFAAAARHAAA